MVLINHSRELHTPGELGIRPKRRTDGSRDIRHFAEVGECRGGISRALFRVVFHHYLGFKMIHYECHA